MRLRLPRSGFLALVCAFIALASLPAAADKPQMLQSPHYRIYFAKEHEQTAGEILQTAEAVWPTLAKAYDAYDNYQVIDIFLSDHGDYANGNAIYSFSRVEIYLPHLNWVMRGRRNWVGNVVTHELAHVFTLRRKARLWIFSDAEVGVFVYDPFKPKLVSYNFLLPWVPLPAPNWWIEGVAQFEAEAAGHDTWDPQRDMIVRDAWLTGTLPSLGEIETFDGDWIQGERTYNTGFAFLRYLRDRYGIDDVRALAVPQPWFHFGGAVEEVFGKSLPDLFAEWKGSLGEKYGAFSSLAKDEPFDKDIRGSFVQSLAFSPDGRYMAWLGNGDREYALNWIYWKETDGTLAGRSGEPISRYAAAPAANARPQAPTLLNGPSFAVPRGLPRPSWPIVPGRNPSQPRRTDEPDPGRSKEFGSAGLEFNRAGDRLLTTRSQWGSPYSDIWEYAFRARGFEAEKWHRLTWNERAADASYHPTARGVVVFSKFEKGSSNLAVLDSTGRIRQLTRFAEGQQVYNPRFTPAGDSIYFTLGMDGKEAIAALSASAPAWDAFEALKDSVPFPDSGFLANGQRLRFVTPLAAASYRDVRFFGDTLLFSTDGEDGAYNIFARLPGDPTMHRMTRARTQALEPVLREGSLYYQGYRRQQFGIFRVPARFEPGDAWPRPSDSLPRTRPKRLDYSKAAESREPGVRKVAWQIQPFVYLTPQFVNDSTLDNLNAVIGLRAALGPIYSGVTQSVEGYTSKRLDLHTPLNYGLTYGGQWSGVTAWHQRYGWTPNLGYSLGRHVRHQVDRESDPAFDTVLVDGGAYNYGYGLDHKFKYTDDIVQGGMSLPLSGMRVGGGTLGTQWYGRYQNSSLTYDQEGSETYTPVSGPGEAQTFPFSGRVVETSLHRHLMQALSLQWFTQALGTKLPQYVGAYASLGQWWTRYALDPVPLDSIPGGFAEALGEDKPIPLLEFTKADFSPWQVDFGAVGAVSRGDWFVLTLQGNGGFFTHKFPAVQDVVPIDAGSQSAVVFASEPHPNLEPLLYKLGGSYMPGYPYRFYYRGRDIMEGTAMAWGRVTLDIPLRVRQYLPYPSPFSSLNTFQITLIGDAGTTLNKTPDQLPRSLGKGEHYLLTDYGAKVSAVFLMYHQMPVELYIQGFKPYNQLKEENVYYGDWARRGYPSARAYLREVQQPRYSVGLISWF